MNETITIRPTRGARRRARRLAIQNPRIHAAVVSRAGETIYDAWVDESRRLSAWIFCNPSGPHDSHWLRRCPATPYFGHKYY